MKRKIIESVFIACVVLANIIASRFVAIGKFIMPGAFVVYAITFLGTDIISELYGRKSSNQLVWCGFIVSAFAVSIIHLVGILPYPVWAKDGIDAYNLYFASSYRIVIGSMVAYLISQLIDVRSFHVIGKLTKGKHKWLRNNLSTMTSQAIDTMIFILIAFGGVVPDIWNMIIAQYVFKLIIAAIDTPIFYLITREKILQRDPK